jgi:hypothetical protein
MLGVQDTVMAIASVESASTWSWLLKIDHSGMFRWYLNGDIETNLRGGTREQAEGALRRFAERSLQGELQITDPVQRLGPDSEQSRIAYKSAGIA